MPLNFATKSLSYTLARFESGSVVNVQYFAFTHAHKPKLAFPISNFFLASFAFLFLSFLFSLSSTFYPLSIHWKSFGLSPSKNLEIEH